MARSRYSSAYRSAPRGTRSRRAVSGGRSGRIVVAVIMALFAIGSYFFTTSRVENPVTGEVQRVSLSPSEEIALGLQAAPEMASQHGGIYPDDELRSYVDRIGNQLVADSSASDTPYQFEFHLLADEQTVNAFALPGGQIFMTAALFEKLQTEGEVAAVLAHEIGHVVARHAAERIAKAGLTEGLTNAAVIAAYDPETASGAHTAQMAQLIGSLVNMRYSRTDEHESDRLAVRLMAETGYDPRALIRLMEVLERSHSGATPPEFMSTHPSSGNRIAEIEAAIQAEFPNGVPSGLR